MLRKYKNQKIYYFGNVVNVDDDVIIPSDIREQKSKSKSFLFIGQPFYLTGALELISAALNIRKQGIDCEVDIIGIEPKLVGVRYPWLKVHGYLDKEKPIEKARYYELLSNARLFVNTTPRWSGFQALLEAMYFYNPILVRSNESLTSYFPNLSAVGHILEEGPNLESILVESLVNKSRYQQMSDNARKSVETSTWNSFTNKLIGLIHE
jgi:glycosyltransferase involved in cell wall biosynthesis